MYPSPCPTVNADVAEDALAIVERYFPAERIPVKTRLALPDLLGA